MDETLSEPKEKEQFTPTPRKKKTDSKKDQERKKQLISFFVIICGIMILLSLLSYSSADEANGDIAFPDIYKVFTNDQLIQQKSQDTSNWLGIGGAVIAHFFINNTVGFFAYVFPFLIIAWGWSTLRQNNLRKLAYITTYTLLFAFLCSSLFGLLRFAGLEEILASEWSGLIGAFIANLIQKFIGNVGGIIFITALLFATITLLIDLDLRATSERLKNFFALFVAKFSGKVEEWKEQQALKKEKIQQEKAIEVKRYDNEIIPQTNSTQQPTQKIEQKVQQEKKSEVEENIIKKDENDVEMQLQESQDIPLTVNEAIQEQEVELDEPEIEDEEIDYVFPSVDLLDNKRYNEKVDDEELKANAALLKEKLGDFGVEIESVSVTPGPVVTLYEIVPATGVKVSKIVNLSNDLALVMQAKGIRIEAPIPGKGTVGVEIPNHKSAIVTIRSILNSEKFRDTKAALPIAMGKTSTGEVFVDDLAKMPHLLIAGATGMGKSVGINTIIASLLYRLHPSEIKFVLVDPKKIELNLYLKLQNHYLAVSPDIDEKIITVPNNAVLVLKSAVLEMEKRYDLLAAAGVRHVTDYNERFKTGKLKGKDTETLRHRFLPYIVVVIDELADLMITAAKEVEEPIARIAQLARAVGIHLVVATQRPSVDVITGVIKANFPARIAYAVSSKIDSRTILDAGGAEQLIGRGDMLYLSSSSPKAMRIQNAYISTEEVEEVVNHIGKQKGYSKQYELPSALEKKRASMFGGSDERDELFEEAARVIVRHQQGSVSLLQRRLKVGYSRAARLVDELEAAGIVGPFDGSKAREVRVETEAELEMMLKNI